MRLRFPVAVQLLATITALTTLAFWPPRTGAMLLVPLGGDMGASVAAGLAATARLAGRGPLPGSLVVVGNRTAIEAQASARSVIVLAAPAAACGRLDA